MKKSVEGVYYIDSVENLGDYVRLGDGFPKAIAFLQKGGLEALSVGSHEIDGDSVYVNVADAELIAPADRPGEIHRAYFDIQLPLGGEETFGLARLDPEWNGEFDADRDVGFLRQPFDWVTLCPGEFAIFCPNACVHAPACTLAAPHVSRKLIVKVRA